MPSTWTPLEISVPYGTISGKAWGNPGGEETQKFLALHGWQDNAGTFDNLIPLLDENVYIVAIDLPGHGLSSHLPPGVPYNDVTYVMDIRRVVKFLEWKKFSFMGHSMGGMLALYYASLYPDEVHMVVCLDVVKPLTSEPEEIPEKLLASIETHLQLEAKSKNLNSPTYTYDQAIQRLIDAHSIFGEITPEAAKALFIRGGKKIDDDKYVFTRDLRLRSLIFTRFNNDALKGFFSRLNCHILILLAKKGVVHDKEEVKKDFLETYRKRSKSFKFVEVEGQHHIHLYDAKAISPFISTFLVQVMYHFVEVYQSIFFEKSVTKQLISTKFSKICCRNSVEGSQHRLAAQISLL